MTRPVTAKQLALLRYLAKPRPYPPTVRELCDAFGLASTNAIADHVRALERKGLVTRNPKTARSLVLTHAGRVAAGLGSPRCNCGQHGPRQEEVSP